MLLIGATQRAEHPRLGGLSLVAEEDSGEVDVTLGRPEVGVAWSAPGATPAAAWFVIDVCLPSWKGRTSPSTMAFASAARNVSA